MLTAFLQQERLVGDAYPAPARSDGRRRYGEAILVAPIRGKSPPTLYDSIRSAICELGLGQGDARSIGMAPAALAVLFSGTMGSVSARTTWWSGRKANGSAGDAAAARRQLTALLYLKPHNRRH